MAKARDAFRTISEVSEWLDTPAHVLRFWESKFSQIKPVKRAGGRRYYRPDDMALLAGIKALLHEQGMTIKGAQKLLREQGVKHVAALSPAIDGQDFQTDIPSDINTIEGTAHVSKPQVAVPLAVTAMPPPTRPTSSVDTKSMDPAPAAIISIPETVAPPRPATVPVLETLCRADVSKALSNQAEIARLVGRLKELRDRMHPG